MSNFDSAVYDSSSLALNLPVNLNMSLSSSGLDVVLDNTGTIGGQNVIGLAYNALSTTNGVLMSLSANGGTTFRMDTAYSGQPIALLLANKQSVKSTAISGLPSTTGVSLSSANTDVSDPETRRLVQMGMI